MGKYRTGLAPTRPDSVKLKLADYFDHNTVLPKIPAAFGHTALITDWGMLGNGPDDNPADVPVGDCADCGPEHIIMAACAAAGRPIPRFTYASTIALYSAVTGYDPSQTQPDGSNPTDQGSDMTQVAEYWCSPGITDADGGIHRITTFAKLNPTDPDQIAAAAWLTDGAVGIGVNLPGSAEDQFDEGVPWSVTDAGIEGGHFVPVVGRAANGNFLIVTWGALVQVEPAFITTYCTMALAYLSQEQLSTKGVTAEGFNWAQLEADMKAVQRL